MPLPCFFLKIEKEKSILKKRHPWIFSNAMQDHRGEVPEDGSMVDIFESDQKTFFGRGYFNGKSQICVRILTRDKNEKIDEAFFEKRFINLKKMRGSFINPSETNAYRLVFAESDGLAGLIVDRYDDVYVIQIHTLGMEQLKPLVVAALAKVLRPRAIYERSDSAARRQDGFSEKATGLLFGTLSSPHVTIRENGLLFTVDVINGQKTGFFLDQRENRAAITKYVSGKHILNCFSYTGGFSVYSAVAGALSVTSVDISEDAMQQARENFSLNGIPTEKHQFVVADAFKYFDQCRASGKTFDLIVLDPPAFAKNRHTLKSGLGGYLHINESALRLLPVGGILASASCSAFVTDELFQKMLTLAARRAYCNLRVLEIRHQPIDHPINLDFPEGKYLKFWICLKSEF